MKVKLTNEISIVSIFLDFGLAYQIETRVNEIMKPLGELKIIFFCSTQKSQSKAQR